MNDIFILESNFKYIKLEKYLNGIYINDMIKSLSLKDFTGNLTMKYEKPWYGKIPLLSILCVVYLIQF